MGLDQNVNYLLYRLGEKDKLLREAMKVLWYHDGFDDERAQLAMKIEEHFKEYDDDPKG